MPSLHIDSCAYAGSLGAHCALEWTRTPGAAWKSFVAERMSDMLLMRRPRLQTNTMAEPETKKSKVQKDGEVPKKAIITGITGQDGSYLAEFLLEKVRARVMGPSALTDLGMVDTVQPSLGFTSRNFLFCAQSEVFVFVRVSFLRAPLRWVSTTVRWVHAPGSLVAEDIFHLARVPCFNED